MDLASRLLPDAYRIELAKLQDEVAPLPIGAIADVIQEDLDSPPEKLSAFLDRNPLGVLPSAKFMSHDFSTAAKWCSKAQSA
jgi:hypothetical protein